MLRVRRMRSGAPISLNLDAICIHLGTNACRRLAERYPVCRVLTLCSTFLHTRVGELDGDPLPTQSRGAYG
jgi:hypothetical protein